MNKNLTQKIGIIGAGPAGLTTAETLKNKGYTHITVLEKADHAGGKCSSVKYQGRSYEMGAAVVTGNNQIVLQLAKKYGVKVDTMDFSRPIFFGDGHTGESLTGKNFYREVVSLLGQILLKYRRLFKRYQNVTTPGFAGIDKDLCEPFTDFQAQHKIPLVAKWFAPFFTGYGYGFLDEIPAAYILKYYSWETVKAVMKKAMYIFPDGFQNLWQTVAKNNHVLYNTTIQKIERKNGVVVTTEKEELSFDALIITSPLDEAVHFLDASEEEKTLFSKIQYYDYRSYAIPAKGFLKQDGYLPGNFTRTRMGHPLFWYHRYADSDLYIFYVIADGKMTDEHILKNIKTFVQPLGGTLGPVHTTAHWKYFPHITPEDMKSGYFDQLENLQGKNNTYYAGELLNFSSTELSGAYAKKLVEAHF